MGQNFAKHVGFTRPNVEAASLKFGSVTILNYGVARDLRQMAHSLKLLIKTLFNFTEKSSQVYQHL